MLQRVCRLVPSLGRCLWLWLCQVAWPWRLLTLLLLLFVHHHQLLLLLLLCLRLRPICRGTTCPRHLTHRAHWCTLTRPASHHDRRESRSLTFRHLVAIIGRLQSSCHLVELLSLPILLILVIRRCFSTSTARPCSKDIPEDGPVPGVGAVGSVKDQHAQTARHALK